VLSRDALTTGSFGRGGLLLEDAAVQPPEVHRVGASTIPVYEEPQQYVYPMWMRHHHAMTGDSREKIDGSAVLPGLNGFG